MRETYAIVVVHRVGSSSDWLQSIQLDYKAIRSTINQRKIRKNTSWKWFCSKKWFIVVEIKLFVIIKWGRKEEFEYRWEKNKSGWFSNKSDVELWYKRELEMFIEWNVVYIGRHSG